MPRFLNVCNLAFFFLAFEISVVFSGNEASCISYNVRINSHLSTKTPYRFIANFNDSSPKYSGCEPIRIVGIVRHGTRTPGHKVNKRLRADLLSIQKHLRKQSPPYKVSESLCDTEKNGLDNWEIYIPDEEEEKVLTHTGEDEMLELAERLQNRFPRLLPEKYSNNTYHFRFTDTQRTKESAKYFTLGLFGRNNLSDRVWFPEAIYKDPILRFYKLCDRWRKEVKKSEMCKAEMRKFIETEEVKEVCTEISNRLGFEKSLSYDVIKLMYVTCSFETAWQPRKRSPWCAVFTEKDAKVLEYAEDLTYYWRDGYGFEINYKQSCPLMAEIHSIFSSESRPTSVFYFTHSGTILKFLSYLGLYHDSIPLTHSLHPDLRETRQWKTSKIDTFGANIIFVLYRCEDGLKVLSLHQEEVVQLPHCPPDDLCPLTTFEKPFSDSINNCNFDEMCSL